jgi:hypothetical protein
VKGVNFIMSAIEIVNQRVGFVEWLLNEPLERQLILGLGSAFVLRLLYTRLFPGTFVEDIIISESAVIDTTEPLAVPPFIKPLEEAPPESVRMSAHLEQSAML